MLEIHIPMTITENSLMYPAAISFWSGGKPIARISTMYSENAYARSITIADNGIKSAKVLRKKSAAAAFPSWLRYLA